MSEIQFNSFASDYMDPLTQRV